MIPQITLQEVLDNFSRAAYTGFTENELLEDNWAEYCSDSLIDLLKPLTLGNRYRALTDTFFEESEIFYGPVKVEDLPEWDIWMPITSVQYPYEGNAEDVFENPSLYTFEDDRFGLGPSAHFEATGIGFKLEEGMVQKRIDDLWLKQK